MFITGKYGGGIKLISHTMKLWAGSESLNIGLEISTSGDGSRPQILGMRLMRSDEKDLVKVISLKINDGTLWVTCLAPGWVYVRTSKTRISN